MQRLLVAFLCALDALIAAAVGLVAVLAPLTLLWVFGLGADADWSALWPATVAVWQLGDLVPLAVELPAEFVAQVGIASDAASFTLSLAPLAFAAFAAIFAARSGARAAAAGAWLTGVIAGAAVFGAIAAVGALTARNDIVTAHLGQAILFPALLYGLAALAGAVVAAWREGDDGPVDRVHRRVDALDDAWSVVPDLVARASAIAVIALIGVGSLVLVAAGVARGAQIVALFGSGHFDALGVIVVTLGQLAYLPTLVVWGIAWVAGPGFAIGTGTAVSPAGTQLAVVPGIPILGLVPQSTSPWLLLVLLLPVGAGVLAGWFARSRFVSRAPRAAESDAWGRPAAEPSIALGTAEAEPVAPRVVVALAIAVLSGGAAAMLSALASGSIGPGRLAFVGPTPGPVGLAVALEVLVGAAIVLLSPRTAERQPKRAGPTTRPESATTADAEPAVPAPGVESTPPITIPVDPAGLGSGRPTPLG